jgi:hypothetical protein
VSLITAMGLRWSSHPPPFQCAAVVEVVEAAQVWAGPHGHCCKMCNCVGGRAIESVVAGIDADLWAFESWSIPAAA